MTDEISLLDDEISISSGKFPKLDYRTGITRFFFRVLDMLGSSWENGLTKEEYKKVEMCLRSFDMALRPYTDTEYIEKTTKIKEYLKTIDWRDKEMRRNVPFDRLLDFFGEITGLLDRRDLLLRQAITAEE